LNNDGWDDIYFVTGGNEFPKRDTFYSDRVYVNKQGEGFEKYNSPLLDSIRFSGKIGKVIDFDQDGDEDLVIGNRMVPQMFPYHAPSFVFENENGELKDVTKKIAPELLEFGIINDIEVADFNQDGFDDFMAVGEWSSVGVFQYDKGAFQNMANKYGLEDKKGWWYSITPTDLNNDGIDDYVIGNIGTNSKYTASDEKPLRVYGGDMDDNGTWDLVLSKKYKDQYVPFRGKECSTQQMPFVSEKFPTYDLFASASIDDVYGAKLEDSYEEYANTFESIAMISKGEDFEVKVLPYKAQHFPILDGISLDGEVVLAGNIYNTEVETPRLDMGKGVFLQMNKNGLNAYQSSSQGLMLDRNIKSMTKVYHKGLNSHFIIAGTNDSRLSIFKEIY